MLAASRVRGLVLAAGILAGCSPRADEGTDHRAGGPADEVQRLRQQHETLVKEYELAAGSAFYVLVDPAAADLTLAYKGTALHRYPIVDARVGLPRIAFINRGERADWTGVVWSGGQLDPQRPSDRAEITAAPPGSTAAAEEPPPPPEVAIPVPATYWLRYDPGLVIEIDRAGDESNAGWKRLLARWRARGRELFAVFSPAERRLTRLRLVLSSADADSLYRSLPPDTKLLIVARGAGQNSGAVARPEASAPRRAS